MLYSRIGINQEKIISPITSEDKQRQTTNAATLEALGENKPKHHTVTEASGRLTKSVDIASEASGKKNKMVLI